MRIGIKAAEPGERSLNFFSKVDKVPFWDIKSALSKYKQ